MTTSAPDRVETTRPDTLPSNGDGDHERFSHFVAKGDLDQALFNGIPAVALCGKKWLPTKDPQKFPVCPTCREIYEGFEDDTDDEMRG